MFLNPFFGNQQPVASQILELSRDNYVTNFGKNGESPAQSPRLLPKFAKNEAEDNDVVLNEIQLRLRPGWTVHRTPDGRFYYCK